MSARDLEDFIKVIESAEKLSNNGGGPTFRSSNNGSCSGRSYPTDIFSPHKIKPVKSGQVPKLWEPRTGSEFLGSSWGSIGAAPACSSKASSSSVTSSPMKYGSKVSTANSSPAKESTKSTPLKKQSSDDRTTLPSKSASTSGKSRSCSNSPSKNLLMDMQRHNRFGRVIAKDLSPAQSPNASPVTKRKTPSSRLPTPGSSKSLTSKSATKSEIESGGESEIEEEHQVTGSDVATPESTQLGSAGPRSSSLSGKRRHCSDQRLKDCHQMTEEEEEKKAGVGSSNSSETEAMTEEGKKTRSPKKKSSPTSPKKSTSVDFREKEIGRTPSRKVPPFSSQSDRSSRKSTGRSIERSLKESASNSAESKSKSSGRISSDPECQSSSAAENPPSSADHSSSPPLARRDHRLKRMSTIHPSAAATAKEEVGEPPFYSDDDDFEEQSAATSRSASSASSRYSSSTSGQSTNKPSVIEKIRGSPSPPRSSPPPKPRPRVTIRQSSVTTHDHHHPSSESLKPKFTPPRRVRPRSAPSPGRLRRKPTTTTEEPQVDLRNYSKSLKLLEIEIASNRKEATKLRNQKLQIRTNSPTLRTRLTSRTQSLSNLQEIIDSKEKMPKDQFEEIRKPLRDAVFQEWYFRKSEIELKRIEEEKKKTTKEDIEKQEKIERSMSRYNSWLTQKKSDLKKKLASARIQKQKLEREKEEENEKADRKKRAELEWQKKKKEIWLQEKKRKEREAEEILEKEKLKEEKVRDAEKHFQAWKDRLDAERNEKLRERREKRREELEDKKEKAKEKIEEAEAAFQGWKKVKEEREREAREKKDRMSPVMKSKKRGGGGRKTPTDGGDSNTEDEDVELSPEERNKLSRQAYEDWLDYIEKREMLEKSGNFMVKPPWY